MCNGFKDHISETTELNGRKLIGICTTRSEESIEGEGTRKKRTPVVDVVASIPLLGMFIAPFLRMLAIEGASPLTLSTVTYTPSCQISGDPRDFPCPPKSDFKGRGSTGQLSLC
jgi:hypothetical protein